MADGDNEIIQECGPHHHAWCGGLPDSVRAAGAPASAPLRRLRRPRRASRSIVTFRPAEGYHCAGPSFLSPVATILSRSAGNGRCSFNASSTSAVSHVSNSAGVVSMTGIAFAWIGRTTSLDSDVRNENSKCSRVSFLRSPVHGRQMPANANSGDRRPGRTNAAPSVDCRCIRRTKSPALGSETQA
jgi:hypothetical protein